MARQLFATTPEEILEGLREIAPSVAISVSWELDPYHSWDGDGPDPREEGYSPYSVTVTAKAIADGEEKEGSDNLGGVYEKSGEKDPDIHGYFPQMVDEALSDLYKEISGRKPRVSRKGWDPRIPVTQNESLLIQIENALKFMTASMREIYELEQRQRDQEERER